MRPIPCEIGREIKLKLIETGITQKGLAEKLGVAESYLTEIIYGRKSPGKYKEKINNFLKS